MPDTGSRIAWQLAQTFWVGGLWLLQFVLLPAMAQRTGLAPLLVEDVAATLRPLMMGLVAVCVALQSLVLLRTRGLPALWRDVRGQLLLVVAALAASHLGLVAMGIDGGYWLAFSVLVTALLGLMLVLQPPPQRAG